MVKRRVFDRAGGPEAFKEMARPGVPVELSYAKGSIQEAARELDIDPGRISKWIGRKQIGPFWNTCLVVMNPLARSIA